MKKLIFLLIPIASFGQVKISDMTSAVSLTGSEFVPIVQTTNKKATIELVRGWGAIGTPSQFLRVNAGATALEFFTPSFLTSETDPLYTANGVPNTRSITINGTAGNITSSAGSQTLANDRTWTLNLATAGTAGTYRSVTTDAFGRVISGTNPTTLSGYGITDQIYLRGGNAFGGASVLGLTDNFNLTVQTANANLLLNTNGSNRLTINNNGLWTSTISAPSGTATVYQYSPSLTGTGSGEFLIGADINGVFSGSLSGSTLNLLRLRNNGNTAIAFNHTGQMLMGQQSGTGWIGVTNSTGTADIAGRTMNWRGSGAWTTSSTVSHLISIREGTIASASAIGIDVSSPSGDFTVNTGTGSQTFRLLALRPNWNITGGTHTLIGYDYDPTNTSLAGVSSHLAWRNLSGSMSIGASNTDDANVRMQVRGIGNGADRALLVEANNGTNVLEIESDGTYIVNGTTGTNGQVLTTNASGVPTWQTPSGGGSGITYAQAKALKFK